MELYAHQEKMVADTRQALKSHRSVVLRSPTGSGKTVCAGYIVSAAIAKNSSVIFTVHRRELIKQTMDTFDMCGIEYGIISAGYKYDPMQNVYIASIDTLKRRLELIPEPSLIICDEAHHIVSAGWSKVMNHYDNAKIVGLSATPSRMDGRGLGEIFGAMVHGPETQWLIDNKFLSPFRAFAPSSPDLGNVHTRGGDYAEDELAEVMDQPKITGDALKHYQNICGGMRAIAFATTVAHSKHIAEEFNAAGVPARHIDGEMSRTERDETIELFRQDKIKVLSNCNIISEGFDVPSMEVAILLRPTKSLALHLQQCGRALRYIEGKTAVLLDHAGNLMEHGLPSDKFEWSLEGRKRGKKKKEVGVKICKQCFCAYPATKRACPVCSFTPETKDREIEHVDGNLTEINLDEWRKNAPYRKVCATAKDYQDFVAIGIARGYKRGWAKIAFEERNGKRKKMQQMSPEEGINRILQSSTSV